jgi:hypothetical protein
MKKFDYDKAKIDDLHRKLAKLLNMDYDTLKSAIELLAFICDTELDMADEEEEKDYALMEFLDKLGASFEDKYPFRSRWTKRLKEQEEKE